MDDVLSNLWILIFVISLYGIFFWKQWKEFKRVNEKKPHRKHRLLRAANDEEPR